MSKVNHLSETGVVVDLTKYSNWEESYVQLKALTGTKNFWKDSSIILRLADFEITEEEVSELKKLVDEVNFTISQIQTNSVRSWKVLREKNFQVSSIPHTKVSNISISGTRMLKQSQVKLPVLPTQIPPNSFEGKTAFIGSTELIALRAGTMISYDGNLVIVGDVNPGCQIRLTGSIIVYGKLCGSIHAGFGITDSEEIQKVFVKALKMGDPLQISIGDYSACSTNENVSDHKLKIYPETARVIDGRIWRISDFD